MHAVGFFHIPFNVLPLLFQTPEERDPVLLLFIPRPRR